MFHVTESPELRSAVTDRVGRHRESLRAKGLRPLQIWIPDTRSASFRKKCEQESQLLLSDPNEAETLAWIAEVADTNGWV